MRGTASIGPGFLTVFVLACGCSDDPKPVADKPGKAGATSASAPATSKVAVAAETGGRADKTPALEAGETGTETGSTAVTLDGLASVGVAICDEYIAAYSKCITEQLPLQQRSTHVATLREEVEAWVRTVEGAGEAAPAALEIGCKSARASAARQTRDLGCDW